MEQRCLYVSAAVEAVEEGDATVSDQQFGAYACGCDETF